MLATGTIIGGKYRLEEPIGQGGMATVWRATHTTLDRAVAVKFLEAVGTQSQQLAARFLQEAKLAAGLRHRHVVDIVDFGVEEEQPYMVMEHLEGASLADRYADGPPVADVELIEIVCMVLSGLAAVHDAGILHRDVKPENIFLVADADGQYPKLLDFGVSRGLGGGHRFTKTGAVVGTPQYMSPEQARGKRDVDHRSDLYAVGTLLYEGFTGEVPFDSENPGDVLIMVATENHVPLVDFRPDLPSGIHDVVERALKKRPDERFSDAREMRNALMQELDWSETTGSFGLPDFSSSGTGVIRVISDADGNVRISDRVKRPSVVTPDELEIPKQPSPKVRVQPPPTPPKLPPPTPRAAAPTPGPDVSQSIQTAVLPPPRVSRPGPSKSDRRWISAAVALAVVVAGGLTFWQLDGMRYLQPPGTPGAVGEVRPGDIVAPAVATVGDEAGETGPISFAPPPTDGVAAPASETVDVPSPPDPPEEAPAEELGPDGDDTDEPAP
ncbi:MAG: serine/threonine-protein kinase [Sandaracinaceae bacterium]